MIFRRQINNISDNFLIILILIFSFLFFSFEEAVKGQNRSASALSTVIIDAGHGGKDPGAVVGQAVEKDIVLDIALRLGQLIRKDLPETKVVYTRKGDYFVPLFKRSVIANNNKADLFISIHANYCESPSIKGTETYVLGWHRSQDNFEVSKKENSVILLEEDHSKRYEGFDPNSPESYIAFELIQNNYIEQSFLFAGMVKGSFRNNAGRSDRDVRQAGFLVLRETAMPSVLIETGYLSNKTEAEYLMTSAGRQAIASAIFNSVKTYKVRFDSRLNLANSGMLQENNPKKEQRDQNTKDSNRIEKEPSERSVALAENETIPEKRQDNSMRQKGEKKKENNTDQEVIADAKKKQSPDANIVHEKIVKKIPEKKMKPDLNTSQEKQGTKKRIAQLKNSKESPGAPEPFVSEKMKKANERPNPVKSSEFTETMKTITKQHADRVTGNTYGIQIAASKVKLPKSFYLFKGIQGIREMEVGGYYKYYCYETNIKNKARESLSWIQQKIPDAFLVIFKEGIPVPLKDVVKKQ